MAIPCQATFEKSGKYDFAKYKKCRRCNDYPKWEYKISEILVLEVPNPLFKR